MLEQNVNWALQETLAECGLALSVEAEAAAGRLVALEIGSRLGIRSARRSLARERTVLLSVCIDATSRIDYHVDD